MTHVAQLTDEGLVTYLWRAEPGDLDTPDAEGDIEDDLFSAYETAMATVRRLENMICALLAAQHQGAQ